MEAYAFAFRPNIAVMHLPCSNHIATLVFTSVGLDLTVCMCIALLNDIVCPVRSNEGLAIMLCTWPTSVKMR
jgi:hypothetical protein